MSPHAAAHGELWGERARDWAEIQEPMVAPAYDAVLRHARVGPGTAVLDVGCGTGLFCSRAAGLGARVSGIDASAPSIAIARERVPGGDFHVGEMEDLPFPDHSFDVVTGFNSFQFASDPVKALAEARRCTRKQGLVSITVWGRAEDCEAATHLAAIASLLPPPSPGAPGPFALSQDGALEALACQAGLEPVMLDEVGVVWIYPDEETLLRGFLSAGPNIKAIRHAGEERVKETTLNAVAPFRTRNGGYEIRNRFRYLIARA